MKQTLILLIIAASILSLTKPSSMHVDYWQLSYNNKTIFSSHCSSDSVITLDLKTFIETDSIKYLYHPCFIDDHVTYQADLYLVTPQKKRYLMSSQKTIGSWFGNFSVMSIKNIVEECNCDTLLFEQTVAASWLNDKGKLKKDKAYTREMLRFRVIK